MLPLLCAHATIDRGHDKSTSCLNVTHLFLSFHQRGGTFNTFWFSLGTSSPFVYLLGIYPQYFAFEVGIEGLILFSWFESCQKFISMLALSSIFLLWL